MIAGRDDGEEGAGPSKKHAEDGMEEDAESEGVPNKILFVQNLPEDAPPAAITAALKQVLAEPFFDFNFCRRVAFMCAPSI
jgi:hypothetical protein